MTSSHAKMALVTLALVCAVPAVGRTADHAPALLQLLRGIDTVPTASDLAKASGGEPATALYRAALDGKLGLFERRRATSLLSAFPGPQTEAYLLVVSRGATERTLRWIAIFTYCRTFGASAPDRVRALAGSMLQSAEPLDREAAVRGLRFVKGAAAGALLDAAWVKEKDNTVRAAIARVRTQR